MLISSGYANAQCKNIQYHTDNPQKYYTIQDSVVFSAKNYCKENKSVLFSLDYKDSTGWQNVDNDIFTSNPWGMNIIKLVPYKSQKFSFKINTIDNIPSQLLSKKVKYRIVENLFFDNEPKYIQIVVMYFWVDYEKYKIK